MTPSERDVMQAALELLESAHVATSLVWKRHKCCDQLRAALAQQESEPVAWRAFNKAQSCWEVTVDADDLLDCRFLLPREPLYASPPAREPTEDPELSAALGWPGGISNPVLDRKELLQIMAERASKGIPTPAREPLAQQESAEPVAWATQLGEFAHISWGPTRPDYPIPFQFPLYASPPAREGE